MNVALRLANHEKTHCNSGFDFLRMVIELHPRESSDTQCDTLFNRRFAVNLQSEDCPVQSLSGI